MCCSNRDAALICENGHLINGDYHTNPSNNQPFCSKCGAPTIHECPHCHKEIPGNYTVEFGYAIPWEIPKYCGHCGKPFPWIQSALESASLIIKEETELSEDLRDLANESLPDIVSETPRTALASTRMKRVISGATSITAEMVRQFVIDFGCELAKKYLGL